MCVVAKYFSFTGASGCYGLLPSSVLSGATTFAIEVKFSTTSGNVNSSDYLCPHIFGRTGGNEFGLCIINGKLALWASTASTRTITSTATVNDGEIHETAVVASGGAIFLYCDEKLVAQLNNSNARTPSSSMYIAWNSYGSTPRLQMDFYEARFWSVARTQEQIFAPIDGNEEGLEAWYVPNENGLLDYSGNERHVTLYGSPTYTELTELPVTLNCDVERKVINEAKTFRYENAGTADSLIISGTTLTDLPETKSKTGTAFYQTQRAKCFDLPVTNEIWVKFDVYWDGINFWRVFNADSGFNPTTPNGYLRIRANGSAVADASTNPCAKNTLQTVLAHMRSGTTDGVIEAWVDGEKIYTYTGDVNHGQDFADIYLQSDGAGTFFSNVIISNAEVKLGDGWHAINFDVERDITKTLAINFDVERQISNSNFLVADFDFERILTRTENFFVDVERKLSNAINFSADMERNLTRTVNLNVDVKRTVEKPQYVAELLAALKVWLPFDESITFDRCNNTWTAIGNPTINDNALQLDGSSRLMSSNIELGGQDFSIDAYVYMDSTSSSGAEFFYIGNSSGFLVVVHRNSNKLQFLLNQDATVTSSTGYNLTSSISSVGKLVHVELNYIYSARTMTLYIDGVQAARRTSCPQYTRAEFSVWLGDSGFVGTIDEFRIFDGLALHSAPFTPPPAGYYEYLKSAPIEVTLSFDVERRITRQVELNFDVQRVLLAPIIVPAIGEHFNHIIGSLKLFSSGAQKIILPKTSGAYIRAVGAGIIKVYSDNDTAGKVTGYGLYKPADMYAVLDECETVYIELTPKTTAQQTILAFMHSLSESTLSGMAAVDAAINYCTGGKFVTKADTESSSNVLNNEIVDKFISDLNNSASYTDFLRDYCDIILGNEDTGAITGSDAGGIEKTPESVVPEKIPVEDWIVPDYGEVVTINGLNVHFPTRGVDGRFSDIEKHILAGLNSVWIKQSLDLIEETYGLSFNDAGASIRDITIKFENYTTRNTTAYVSYETISGKVTELTLTVNMRYYKDIDMTNTDGLLIPSSQYYYAAGYLDRTIAHELTHAVMVANIDYFGHLPLYIREGTAELVHGIDDLREDTIVELLTTNQDSMESILRGIWSPLGAISYAAGYVFLRYLAKQGQNYELIPQELEISNLLISDGATDSNYNALTDNTRQILYPDVLCELINRTELLLDVEILSVIRVDFTADVKRALLMHVNLFPMNREDFFADENNPYVVRTNKSRLRKLRAGQSQNPFNIANNTPGMQSFEVAIAEQQVTDQVRFTRVLPASADYFEQFSMNIGQWDIDIMQEFRGKYLDYEYNMRVERIQRQGRTYSCECCSDLDKLLYTQLAYTVPETTTWTSGEGTSEEKTIETVFPQASAHAKSIAEALGLTFNMKEHGRFGDFLSTVLTEDMGGVTYNDLIRDIFGWSLRIPHKMINVYIRNNTLEIIERGYEPNMIDISAAEKSEPIITRELVRTAWGSSITSETTTTEIITQNFVPADKPVPNKPDEPDEPDEPVIPQDPEKEVYAEGTTRIDGIDVEGYTHYSYNSDGKLRKVKSYSRQKSTGNTTDTTTHHSYDSDGALRETRTTTTAKVYDEKGNSTTTETKSINEKSYVTLSTGEKFLSAEYSARYENGTLVDEQTITHSPTRVGQGHAIAISADGTILGESSGQNTGDDRTTPYNKAKAINTVKSNPVKTVVWDEELEAWVVGSYETKNQSTTTTVYGLSLYDSSFPIHNEDKLIQVTQDLKALNRATKETVHITVYNFPHLIDFLDRIVLYGRVYHLSSNIARSNQDILSEQQLTLVKWDLSAVEG